MSSPEVLRYLIGVTPGVKLLTPDSGGVSLATVNDWASLTEGEELRPQPDEWLIKTARYCLDDQIWTWIGLYQHAFQLGGKRPGGILGAGLLLRNAYVQGGHALTFLPKVVARLRALALVDGKFTRKVEDLHDFPWADHDPLLEGGIFELDDQRDRGLDPARSEQVFLDLSDGGESQFSSWYVDWAQIGRPFAGFSRMLLAGSARIAESARSIENMSAFTSHQFATASFEWMQDPPPEPAIDETAVDGAEGPQFGQPGYELGDTGAVMDWSPAAADAPRGLARFGDSGRDRGGFRDDYAAAGHGSPSATQWQWLVQQQREDRQALVGLVVAERSKQWYNGALWGGGVTAALIFLGLMLQSGGLGFSRRAPPAQSADVSAGPEHVGGPSAVAPSASNVDPADTAAIRDIVGQFFGHLEQRRYDRAAALWSSDGVPANLTESRLAEALRNYREYHAAIDTGESIAADEQGDIWVPIRVSARRRDGDQIQSQGHVVLRRDQNGSLGGAPRWRLLRIDTNDRAANPLS